MLKCESRALDLRLEVLWKHAVQPLMFTMAPVYALVHLTVVKVAGSNISHKLRLSSVKPADEGTYECHVIDFSDSQLRHHRVRAYLQVERAEGNVPPPAQQGATSKEERLQSDHHKHHKPGRELRKRSADDSTTDCTESCVL
ncbi:V-set and transmembrane domain-containing protein 2-like protein [Sinocyclocheilus grahami]|uniref:V-set and transmembrane domain-containing protein 2-like protein n=1 Tax=Sinocyclocheilus grahami TaxID=75366 RepID=UPI0007AD04DF|nr:PREDICTED: V-set and transmembrane domain-containing protein 2-like protein [Sinocyclocheilus grahami]